MADVIVAQKKTNFLTTNGNNNNNNTSLNSNNNEIQEENGNLEPVFPKAISLLLNTGNIVSANRIKRKLNSISNDEIIESLNSVFANWLHSVDQLNVQEQKSVICRDPELYEKLEANERDDVAISVKIFLNTLDPTVLEKAIYKILEELGVSHIETFIISLPDTIFNKIELDKNILKPLWTIIEKILNEKSISSVGVCDLNKNYLEQLCNIIENKQYYPSLNQVNLSSCCVMPTELIEFAKLNEIQLTTHNDPREILTADTLQACIRTSAHEYDSANWVPQWTARYTLILKGRGIVKSKGYIVNAQRELRYTK